MSTVQLDFSRLHALYGRSEELKQLQNAFSDPKRPPVLLEAPSGSGKSTLIDAFVRPKLSEAFCGQGKFEETTSVDPFAALLDAVGELVVCLIRDDAQTWSERIQSGMEEPQIPLLRTMIPKLTELIGQKDDGSDPLAVVRGDEKNTTNDEYGFDRLRFALRALVSTICEYHAVILILDDLQWASPDSLVLIETLVCEERLFFVGAHRPTEVLSERKFWMNSSCVKIQLASLDETTVTSMISDLVGRPPDDVSPLATVVSQKTGGNAFFVVQFLRMLERKGLLVYDWKATCRWTWSVRHILSETDVADNVLELLTDKIRTLPEIQQQVLVYAAALGSSHFLATDIAILLEDGETTNQAISQDDLLAACQGVTDSSLVENLGAGMFKFAHDRIREAAYSLLPEGRARREIHLSIGRKLRVLLNDEMDSSRRELVWLQAVGQMNLGSDCISDPREKVRLAEMSYEVATLVAERSAFFLASDFLQIGIRLLGESPWVDHHYLMMKMSVAQTTVWHCCGRHDEVIRLADTALAHARSFDERRDLRNTKIAVLIQHDPKKAFELLRDTLAELGHPLPRRMLKFHVLRLLLKLKKMTRDWSDDDFLSLPPATDRVLVEVMETYHFLGDLFVSSPNDDVQALTMLRCFELTMRHGYFPASCTAVACWGIVLSYEGKFDDAFRFGNLTLKLLDRSKSSYHRAMSKEAVYCFLSHWRRPVHEGLEPLLIARADCWKDGNVSHVVMCAGAYLQLYIFSGLKLAPLEKDIHTFARELRDYKQDRFYVLLSPMFQLIVNLTGSSGSGVSFTGEFLHGDKSIASMKTSQNKGALDAYFMYRMILAYLLDDLATAAEMSSKVCKTAGVKGPYVLLPFRKFYQCMIALDLSQSTRRLNYRRQSRAIIRQFRLWVQEGAVNCHHIYLLLLAQAATVAPASDAERVRHRFDEAIAACARSGFLHHHALANEKAGVFFQSLGDRHWASTYLSRARDVYADWGAMAKVWQMEGKYKSLLSESSRATGGGMKARSRLDDLSTQQSQRMSTVLKHQQQEMYDQEGVATS